MTDKELLELAAKAAGLNLRYCEPWNAMAQYTMDDGYFGKSWNPLTDDGDALRLAVKLKMSIHCLKHESSVLIYFGSIECTEKVEDDPYAATRRAIVRAAAEIGKEMP